MKKTLLLIIVCQFFIVNLFGGNIPCDATPLDNNMDDFISFSNLGNTDSGFTPPPYGGYGGIDFWFEFTAISSNLYLRINGQSLTNPAIGIYEGPCDDLNLIYNVLDDNCDGSSGPSIEFTELEAGATYFIRLWPENNSVNGSFEIQLNDNNSSIDEFDVFNDATYQGDCILLTDNLNTQNGCAWNQTEIDFTQAFSHSMSANFGNNDGGADGICLVYQSTSSSYCGESGGGIGALNMPNSAIFEFDTWQNNQYNDPFQDHTGFGINGDLNHANNIAGPVSLGNIEDGVDHEIVFNWDPVGNNFELFFDGLLVLSGSYDIITNCFGGNNMAYWGYTAATGGANNEHLICPVVEVVDFGTQHYEEVVLCEGEDFNGYDQPGFYVDFEVMDNGCMHQNNYNIIVHDTPDPVFINEIICEGDFVIYNNEAFFEEGIHELNLQTAFGCDSLIYLEIEHIELTADIIIDGELTCENPEIGLFSVFNTDLVFVGVSYLWVGPNLISFDPNITVTEPGEYFLTVTIEYFEFTCEVITSVIIEASLDEPVFDGPFDISLGCSGGGTTELITFPPNVDYDYTWTYETTEIGYGPTQETIGPGTYYVEVVNTLNGCSRIDSAMVEVTTDFPIVEINGNAITCSKDSSIISLESDDELATFEWIFEGEIVGNEDTLIAFEEGLYEVNIVAQNGCEVTESITIIEDNGVPEIGVSDYTFPCGIINDIISVNIGDNIDITWELPDGTTSNNIDLEVFENGTYYITAIDTITGCMELDSSLVVFNGLEPMLELSADSITCNVEQVLITSMADQNDLDYTWNHEGNTVGNDMNLEVDSPGIYILETSTQNACVSYDTIEIFADISYPEISLTGEDLDCDNLIAEVAATTNGNTIQWTGPNEFESENLVFETNVPGTYYAQVTNTSNGCSSIDSLEVLSSGTIPSYTLSPDTISCKKMTLNLDLSVFSDFESVLWTGPGGFVSNDVSPMITEDGLYELHLDVEGECDVDTSLMIFGLFDNPDFQLTAEGFTCDVKSADVTATITSGELVQWSGPNGFQSSDLMFTTEELGVYIAEFVDPVSGCTLIDSVEVTSQGDYPEYFIFDDTLTCAKNVIYAELNITSAFDSVYWTGNNAYESTDVQAEITEPGIYSAHIFTANGCDIDTLITIEEDVETYPIDIVASDIDCTNPMSDISVTAGEAVNIYAITPSGFEFDDFIFDPNLEENVLIYQTNEAGIHVFYSIWPNGCIDSSEHVVAEFLDIPNLMLDSEGPLTCNNNMSSITSETDLDVIQYIWTGPNSFFADTENINIDEAGTYILEVTNEHGCKNTVETNIEGFFEGSEFDLFGEDLICNETNTVLSYESIDNVETVTWENQFGEMNFTDDWSVEQEGWYYLSLENEYGCSQTDSIFIFANNETPEVSLVTPDTIELVKGNIEKILIDVQSNIDYSIQWTPSTGLSCDDCLNPELLNADISEYTVTITNEYGCTSELTIYVREKLIDEVYIPNIFYPNSDDLANRYFTIFANENIESINNMEIYDRWGELVFIREDFQPNVPELGWNGDFKGSQAMSGVYVYVVKVMSLSGETRQFNGSVTLVR